MDPIIYYTITLSLSLMFMFACLNKFQNLAEFKQSLIAYRLVPQAFTSITTHSLPSLEALCSITLLIPTTELFGQILALCLLLLYTAALSIKVMQGETDSDCGCHLGATTGPTKISSALILRNSGIILGSILLIFVPLNTRELIFLDYMLIGFALVVTCFCLISINQLIHNHVRYQEIR